jgi:segregation and condensation protein B
VAQEHGLDRDNLKSIVEGLIFASPEPLDVKTISHILPETTLSQVQAIVTELQHEYEGRERGFRLSSVAGGYQFRSLPAIGPWISELRKARPARLTRAALETLAIVAYNQPVTRARVEEIRGVESSGTLKGLMERGLIEVAGRKDVPGRPLLYGTSKRFLEVFGLNDLASLPALPELAADEIMANAHKQNGDE